MFTLGGVPVNVMEIVHFPNEGTEENNQAIEVSLDALPQV